MADMDVFAAMGFAGFGKKNFKMTLDSGAYAAPAPTPDGDGSDDDDDEEPGPLPPSALDALEEPELDPDDEGFDAAADGLPITHELILSDHAKVVSAMARDPSGARVLSGSHDYDCKLWDFGGMSGSGPKPFMQDLGAGGELSSLSRHSSTSTISVIVIKSRERGARTKVTTCVYSPDGRGISQEGPTAEKTHLACLDGALHLVRPNMTVQAAHTKGTETGSLGFSVDGHTIPTRGGDNIVKPGVLTLYPTTNAIFSPDNKYVVTGVGASGEGEKGSLLFLCRGNVEVEKQLEVDSTPAVVQWHPKITTKYLVVGLTSGKICVQYSLHTSLNGAKLLLNKGPAKRPTPTILTPHALLPMFRDGEIARGSKRKHEKERMDPRKSHRPELPVTGAGRRGRVGASATQHVVQNLVRDTTRDEDPREALLKDAQGGEDDPQWTGAWRVNEPKPVFAEAEGETDDDDGL
ncbi:hypothetical protein FA95DRAFT_1582219 [Auriscalpium vulgare]|uniref:Uncharacterized protein n=1 Tax=Auriscalpium vulgare TaxID=40419 RepID=A0ACB8RW24_9AGAM|nr:hypothetical protein FA95DRAFT_1582219 [Auriscalpium vulgare]